MILCADDFGSAADIDHCIVKLAAQRKISAVAIQAAALNGSSPDLDQLRRLQPPVDLGLQFVLTAPGRPDNSSPAESLCAQGCFLSRGGLLLRCLRRRVSVPEVRNQLAAQYARFVQLCGRPPDFLASHGHVHQFPCIREGLLELATHLRQELRLYIRQTYEPLPIVFQRGVAPYACWRLGLFGRTLLRRLQALGLPTNIGFGGLSDPARWTEYPLFLRQFLQFARQPNSLVVVHPGLQEPWRIAEFNALLNMDLSMNPPARFAYPKGSPVGPGQSGGELTPDRKSGASDGMSVQREFGVDSPDV